MRNILLKEMKLSASVLSYFFVLFGLMFFLPGYPVLCGVFFVTLGIFQSFQNARETNDILFSSLLPIAKRDVVNGKYLFVVLIELCSIALMGIAVLIRATVFADAAVYRENALMNANGFALGMAFVMFGEFNSIFVGGFFKTAYRFGKPFLFYNVFTFLTIGLAETLHHIPGLEALNAFGFNHPEMQISSLLIGMIIYIVLTMISCAKSRVKFEKIDL